VRRENIRRRRNGEDGRRRSVPVRRRQCRERWKSGRRWQRGKRRQNGGNAWAQEKAMWEAAAEEQRQSLTMGLSGLKLTIPAPASIAWMTSSSSTQSKGKKKVTEEEPSASQYVSFIQFFVHC
jgi:hypothetical protein